MGSNGVCRALETGRATGSSSRIGHFSRQQTLCSEFGMSPSAKTRFIVNNGTQNEMRQLCLGSRDDETFRS